MVILREFKYVTIETPYQLVQFAFNNITANITIFILIFKTLLKFILRPNKVMIP